MRTSSTAVRRASAGRKNASNAGVDVRPSEGVSLMRTLRIGHLAIGLATVVGVVPPALAQAPEVPGLGRPAGSEIGAEERQTQQRPGSDTGVSVAVPMGRVSVGAEFVNGEPIFVRRTTVRAG